MNDFNFENNAEGDWEEKGEFSWDEFEWKKYLLRVQADIDRFLSYYDHSPWEANRLDKIAHAMGWDTGEWSRSESDLFDLEGMQMDSQSRLPEEEGPFEEDAEPYTIHRHPVYIVTKALYQFLESSWARIVDQSGDSLSAREVWNFSRHLQNGETNAILAVQALDMGDYALAVCQLKMALEAVNLSLKNTQEFARKNNALLKPFRLEAQKRLFDLREVWLRTMRDCREEVQRRSQEGD